MLWYNIIFAMSFFNKLFGGGDKPDKPAKGPAAPPKPKEDSTDAKKLKIEHACVILDSKINEFEDKEKNSSKRWTS